MNPIKALRKEIDKYQVAQQSERPFVSVVVPAYNEAAIIRENLLQICEYMETLEREYDWELIVVNDGSTDETGKLADKFAESRGNVYVLHHHTNFQLGQALKFAFNNCTGDYVVVMDVDLTYSPYHIGQLLAKIRETKAKIVIASPYMEGGRVSNVPWLRRILSRWANKFLSITAKGKLSTITGMVRAYDRKFIASLNLKAMDMGINPEIVYKAQLLRAMIVEIPAILDWSFQKTVGKKRSSSMRVLWNILSCLFSGFIFRPFMFFILPGLTLLILSFYPIAWALIHTIAQLENPALLNLTFDHRLSAAVAQAFSLSPHSFIVGGVCLMVAIQLMSLGILALQNKRYFEELFHLGSTIYKITKKDENLSQHS
jgi:glycosyltransferase involved in cell wall biosynthesis